MVPGLAIEIDDDHPYKPRGRVSPRTTTSPSAAQDGDLEHEDDQGEEKTKQGLDWFRSRPRAGGRVTDIISTRRWRIFRRCVTAAIVLLIFSIAFNSLIVPEVKVLPADLNVEAEVTGVITAEREEGRLNFLASYRGSYQAYRDQKDANAPEHRLRLRGSYDIDPRTTLHVNNRYRDVRNLRFTREDILDGDTGLTPNNDRYRRNDLEIMLHRDLSRVWELELHATHQFIALDNPERSDSDSYEIGACARIGIACLLERQKNIAL